MAARSTKSITYGSRTPWSDYRGPATYLKAIRACGDSLKAERAKMNSLEALAYPGSIGSAVQTQRNLQDDVTGLGGIQSTVDYYLDYLDAFEATVKNTTDLTLKSG
jgi:hypothetical protein